MHKKVVGITIVKNEVDVIESFVRHNLNFLDELHIIEHCSNDNTKNILTLLHQEGLPIYFYQFDKSNCRQEQMMTVLLQHCLKSDPSIAYCLPIDADEFIDCPDKATFIRLIDTIPSDRVGLLFFNHYLPSDIAFNPYFLSKFTEIRQEEMLISRVIIPRSFGLKGRFLIGYNLFFDKSPEAKSFPYFAFLPFKYTHFQSDIATKHNVIFCKTDDLILAHYPVRSYLQYLVKLLTDSIVMRIQNKQDGNDHSYIIRANHYLSYNQYTLEDLRKESYAYKRSPYTEYDFSKVTIAIAETKALVRMPYSLKYLNQVELNPIKSLYQEGINMIDFYTKSLLKKEA